MPEAVYHPIVRTHPENGRKSIYINPIRIDAIDGMEEADALDLLNELLQHAIQDQFQYRHKWQPGDLVMWDNRCLLHARTDFPRDQRRLLRRVTISDEAAVMAA